MGTPDALQTLENIESIIYIHHLLCEFCIVVLLLLHRARALALVVIPTEAPDFHVTRITPAIRWLLIFRGKNRISRLARVPRGCCQCLCAVNHNDLMRRLPEQRDGTCFRKVKSMGCDGVPEAVLGDVHCAGCLSLVCKATRDRRLLGSVRRGISCTDGATSTQRSTVKSLL